MLLSLDLQISNSLITCSLQQLYRVHVFAIYMCVCVCIYTHVCVCVCTYAHVCVCVCVCVHMHTCVCIFKIS